jgi:hypothetical protein
MTARQGFGDPVTGASFMSAAPCALFLPPRPASPRVPSGCDTSFAATAHSMGGGPLCSAVTSIRELLFSAIEKSLVAGENHLPQFRDFRNVGIVRFLGDASLKFKRLSH